MQIGQNKKRIQTNELCYSSGMMSQSFWFIEFKKLVHLIAEERSDDYIKRECLDNNLFGAANAYREKRMYGYLINRAGMLDERMIRIFASGDISTQKLINLIAIVKGDRLFFEFINEVYREKIILGQHEISDIDFNAFFRGKGSQSDVVEQWSDGTKKRLKSVYLSCMTEAGLLRAEKRKRLITEPLVDEELAACLEDGGDRSVLIAITGRA